MRYIPDPEKQYDDMINDIGSMRIRMDGGNIEPLCKRDYVKMIKDFGVMANLAPMTEIDLIHGRL